MSPRPQIEPWSGPNDNTRDLRTDYFIPADLQVDFGQLKKVLSEVVTPERVARLTQVAQTRTRAVMPVFESTHHSHNISAVLRTADAFGFQDVGFVYHQSDMKFRVNDSVERGSSTWLLTRRTDSIEACAQSLKSSGYKIFLVSLPTFARTAEHYEGTLPSFAAHQIGNQEFCRLVGKSRIALVSGNEKFGISESWAKYADGYLHVEMNGFVESLNVSVCAGILLHALRFQWFEKISDFNLTIPEQNLLVEHWLARSCQNARQIVERENTALVPWFEFVRGGRFYQPF
ncbi:MAG: TrmH family RNA methyltransferase [Silvanigrellaceae bacterium]